MDTKEKIKTELSTLYKEGVEIAQKFQAEDEKQNFPYEYQRWYTRALRVVDVVASDRHDEFRLYYEKDPKRKSLGYGTYVIQDYLRAVAPNRHSYPEFDTREQTLNNFFNQLTIIEAIDSRVDSVLNNIESELLSELQDSELETAKRLLKESIRAAGSLTGVVLENYLQKLVKNHKITMRKKNPTISDLNDPLKNEKVIDTPTWRKISYLADIRNLCSHKKDAEPTKEQVLELIDGTNWVIKNVF